MANTEWQDRIRRTVDSGRKTIIAHFNIDDELVVDGELRSVKDMCADVLNAEGVIKFSLAGWEFDSEETETIFRDVCNLPNKPEDPGEAPVFDEENAQPYYDWEEKNELWKQWLNLVKKAEEEGVSPMKYLAMVKADELDEVIDTMDIFVNSPKSKNMVIMIDAAHTVVPVGEISSMGLTQRKMQVIIGKWADRGEDSPSIVLFASSLVDLDKNLYGRGSSVATINIPYPSDDQRTRYLRLLQKEMKFKKNGESLEDIARVGAGLSNRHIKALVQECVVEDKVVTIDLVREYKQNVVSDELAGLVTFVNPERGFEAIGGLAHVKGVFSDIADAISNGRDWLVPMGVLLTGPPGTGKTVVAEAFAKKVGFNFITLGNVKSKWVGESERNIHKVFEVAKSLAPVIIFVDEIDQEGQRGYDGDGGVSNHIFAEILRTMSDTDLRGKIMWIAATNRPDLMDAAMKRPGRFDIRMPLLYPNVAERSEIFQAHIHTYDLASGRDVDFDTLGKNTTGYNGADIEVIVLSAARFAYADKQGKVIGMKHFLDAIDDYIPHHDKKSIDHMTEMALAETSSISLLPEPYKTKKREEKDRERRRNLGEGGSTLTFQSVD